MRVVKLLGQKKKNMNFLITFDEELTMYLPSSNQIQKQICKTSTIIGISRYAQVNPCSRLASTGINWTRKPLWFGN